MLFFSSILFFFLFFNFVALAGIPYFSIDQTAGL